MTGWHDSQQPRRQLLQRHRQKCKLVALSDLEGSAAAGGMNQLYLLLPLPAVPNLVSAKCQVTAGAASIRTPFDTSGGSSGSACAQQGGPCSPSLPSALLGVRLCTLTRRGQPKPT